MIRRTLHPPSPYTAPIQVARALLRAAPAISRSPLHPPTHLLSSRQTIHFGISSNRWPLFDRGFELLRGGGDATEGGRIMASQYSTNVEAAKLPEKSEEQEQELNVYICIEDDLPDGDPEIMSIAGQLRLDVPMAIQLAFDRLTNCSYKTRDTAAIEDVGGFRVVELSVLLCNDEFIRKLNKDWRDVDHATDVLSMSQHDPDLNLSNLMMGDIVISVETAARQADERGHSLLDEIRILMVHGLLHLLGFDHELSEDAEEEMKEEEEIVLRSLEWNGKGLIMSAYDPGNDEQMSLFHPLQKQGNT